MPKNTKWIVLVSLLLVGIAIVASSMLPKSTAYYLTVSELLAAEQKYQNQELKVAGTVAPGSIIHEGKTSSWRFEVVHEEASIWVNYVGAMPDTFKEEAEVVVTGSIVANSGEMEASHVLAKCASRYEEKIKPSLKASDTACGALPEAMEHSS